VALNLGGLVKEKLEPLSVAQLKSVRTLIDDSMKKNNEDLLSLEKIRFEFENSHDLKKGHHSCPLIMTISLR